MLCNHDPYEVTAPFTHITVLFIGVVLGFFGFATLTHFDPRPALHIDCSRIGCHRPAPLNTIKKYKTYHRTRPEFQASLLKELEAAR